MLNRIKLVQATTMLSEVLTEWEGTKTEFKDQPLNSVLAGWFLSREDYNALDTLRKSINEMLEEASRHTLPAIMRAADSKTVTLDSLGRRFTVSQRVSCSILEGKREEGHEWLRSVNMADIIVSTVNAQTLGSYAKKRIKEEGKDMPDDIFKVGYMDTVSATKV